MHQIIGTILGGSSPSWTLEQLQLFVQIPEAKAVLAELESRGLRQTLISFADVIVNSQDPLLLQLWAVALLQTFIQANFTGPEIGFSSRNEIFPDTNEELLQLSLIHI